MQLLEDIEHFDTLLASWTDFIIFKHSRRCSISWWACKELYQAIEELAIDNIYLLDVLTTIDLKYYVAEKMQIKHESPQVIIFQQGKAIAHASHRSISKGRFAQVLQGWHDTRKK